MGLYLIPAQFKQRYSRGKRERQIPHAGNCGHRRRSNSVNVDVGFGDASERGAEWLDRPVLLDLLPPRLRAYAREKFIAEKYRAMVDLGMANSRMKDYYDLWIISEAFNIDHSRFAQAISATIARRDTLIPMETSDGVTPVFADGPAKRQHWESIKRGLVIDPGALDGVICSLVAYPMLAATAALDCIGWGEAEG